MIPYYQDPYIVLLSVFVAIIGCLTGMATIWLLKVPVKKRSNVVQLWQGAAVIGSTIWSMHFVAMNAVRAPIPLSYEVATTGLSLVLAIVVTAIGLYLANSGDALSIPAGGTIMGLGIAGMHYLGMAAIRGCSVGYDAKGVALSILIGIVASTVALAFSLRRRSLVVTVAGSVIMGIAICSLHYTAMAATSFFEGNDTGSFSLMLVNAGFLAYVVAAIAGTTYSAVLAAMAEGKL